MAEKCQAVAGSGQQCKAWAMTGSPFCYNHNPDMASKRTASRAKGGRSSAALHKLRPVTIASVADWLPLLATLANDLLQNELRPVQRARAVAHLARTYCDIAMSSELEARLEAIERELEQRSEAG